MIQNFDQLITAVKKRPKKKIAIAAPEGTTVIKLVKQAIEANLAEFVLVGDEEKIKSMSADAGFDAHLINIVNITNQKEAAEEAVRLVLIGSANAIMKGNLPTPAGGKYVTQVPRLLHKTKNCCCVNGCKSSGHINF